MTRSSSENYYEVLGCEPTDSTDRIKKSYQSLILKYHPDKQNHENSDNDEKTDEATKIKRFHEIDFAWKILRDPDKRKQYDAEMQQQRFNGEPIVHERLHCTEFEFDPESKLCVYPCRCGGVFVLPEEFSPAAETTNESNPTNNSYDNEADDIYIECDECSFVLQLITRS